MVEIRIVSGVPSSAFFIFPRRVDTKSKQIPPTENLSLLGTLGGCQCYE
jgi:hypothetical protein